MCKQGVFDLFLWPGSVCLTPVESRGLNIFKCSLHSVIQPTLRQNVNRNVLYNIYFF